MDQLHHERDVDAVSQGAPGFTAEARLIADVLLGDRKAIAEFVDQYSDDVFRFISRRIDDHSTVEDLSQDVFLVAWSALRGFRLNSSVKTWLCGIAQNKVADFYRRKLRELPQQQDEGEQETDLHASSLIDVEQDLDRRLIEEQIRLTMLKLPEGHRAILRWRYWDAIPMREMALQTGKTIKSLERLLARARIEFAAKWKEAQHGKKAG